MIKELNELSKKTLGNYIVKSTIRGQNHATSVGESPLGSSSENLHYKK